MTYWFRWWKWFLWDHPSPLMLVMSGLDRQSRKILYDRHMEKEPKR